MKPNQKRAKMRSGSSKGKSEKPKAEKNKQKVCGAPWGMRQKEIEKSKKEGVRPRKNGMQTSADENGKPGGDEGLGNKSGGAASRRDRQPRSDNGKRIAGTAKANA